MSKPRLPLPPRNGNLDHEIEAHLDKTTHRWVRRQGNGTISDGLRRVLAQAEKLHDEENDNGIHD